MEYVTCMCHMFLYKYEILYYTTTTITTVTAAATTAAVYRCSSVSFDGPLPWNPE